MYILVKYAKKRQVQWAIYKRGWEGRGRRVDRYIIRKFVNKIEIAVKSNELEMVYTICPIFLC